VTVERPPPGWNSEMRAARPDWSTTPREGERQQFPAWPAEPDRRGIVTAIRHHLILAARQGDSGLGDLPRTEGGMLVPEQEA